ncbi:MAG: ATP-binding cassette domain-containing protein [Sulfuriferula multivorans]|uniref:ATP-binding cassette domain-containing protein n=1 Tax=Sulfuriferula multivorans TaxID=1559896 RepID=A0A7C9NSX6_9PROT|nr:ATP-binding cassette domain-containing protein [Sulfuriferula multivorans]
MAKLLIHADQQPLREIRLYKPRTKIGRASDCEIQLPSSRVSRKHALISREGDAYFIEDLGSTNSVLLNQEKIQRAPLQHGDRIGIHHFVLDFIEDVAENHDAADKLVIVEDVSKDYALGKQTVTALQHVSLSVAQGEFMALAGPSGSGKSTLLNLIGCIDTPTSGRISIHGNDIGDKSPDALSDLRLNTLGFVFQTFNLLPVLSAWENVEYPLLQQRDIDKEARRKRIEHYLKVVGLERFAHHRPNELSGGQRQRVAIARALATHPKIVLADEPTANLDHKTGEDILRLMKQLNQEEGTTFIFSTHDMRVMEMADRVIELADGQITE